MPTTNEEQSNEFITRTEFHEAITEIRKDISGLGRTLSSETRPNFSTMAAWAGILLTVIAMVAAPVAYHFNSVVAEMDKKLQKEYGLVTEAIGERVHSVDRQIVELDSRLQREFGLANVGMEKTATALRDQVNHTTLLLDSMRTGDLEELRKWRTGQIKKQ